MNWIAKRFRRWRRERAKRQCRQKFRRLSRETQAMLRYMRCAPEDAFSDDAEEDEAPVIAGGRWSLGVGEKTS